MGAVSSSTEGVFSRRGDLMDKVSGGPGLVVEWEAGLERGAEERGVGEICKEALPLCLSLAPE